MIGLALLLGFGLRWADGSLVNRLLSWLGAIGWWGPVIFILLTIVVVLLVLPGLPLTLGAGFLFGPIAGTLYVVVGHTIGGSLALLAARNLFGDRAANYLLQRPQLQELNQRFSEQGWKTILLTRLIPFFPFKLSNYAFGLMGVHVRDFIIGTAIGTIPISATNVYAGSLAADIASMQATSGNDVLPWVMRGIGLIALPLLLLFVRKIAQERWTASK